MDDTTKLTDQLAAQGLLEPRRPSGRVTPLDDELADVLRARSRAAVVALERRRAAARAAVYGGLFVAVPGRC
jgi:hypothetical protein